MSNELGFMLTGCVLMFGYLLWRVLSERGPKGSRLIDDPGVWPLILVLSAFWPVTVVMLLFLPTVVRRKQIREIRKKHGHGP